MAGPPVVPPHDAAVVFQRRTIESGSAVHLLESSDIDDIVAGLSLTKPVGGQSVRVPAAELLPRLGGAANPTDVLSALLAAGIGPREAQPFAAVLGGATATVEIVALDDGQRLLPGAVGVFCSPRGDVVTVPSTAADGAEWLTLAPATPRRVGLACAELVQRRRAVR